MLRAARSGAFSARRGREYAQDEEAIKRSYRSRKVLQPEIPLRGKAVSAARRAGEQYRARTLKNVQDSDGTVILYSGSLSGGTLLTQKLCMKEKKQSLALDAQAMTKLRAAGAVAHFVEEHGVSVLNVAGPRLSGWPAGYRYALGVVGAVLSNL